MIFKSITMIKETDYTKIAKLAWINSNKNLNIYLYYSKNRFIYHTPTHAEMFLRKYLGEMLKCFWFYRNARNGISILMHAVGVYLEEKYGCPLKIKNECIIEDCPNMLLHKNFGFSARMHSELVCSICGNDPLFCEHRTGKYYNGVLCEKIEIPKEIISFDIVKEPKQIFTRLTEIHHHISTISIGNRKTSISDLNSDRFILCHHCRQCAGFDETRDILDWSLQWYQGM